MLVLGERGIILAALGALRCALYIPARRQLANNVMVASGHLIGIASEIGPVITTRDDANGVPVVPCGRRVPALTSLTAREDAACGVNITLSRKHNTAESNGTQ